MVRMCGETKARIDGIISVILELAETLKPPTATDESPNAPPPQLHHKFQPSQSLSVQKSALSMRYDRLIYQLQYFDACPLFKHATCERPECPLRVPPMPFFEVVGGYTSQGHNLGEYSI